MLVWTYYSQKNILDRQLSIVDLKYIPDCCDPVDISSLALFLIGVPEEEAPFGSVESPLQIEHLHFLE